MDNVLFLLIDSCESSFFKRYASELKLIHQQLLDRLPQENVLSVGTQESAIASHKFSNLRSLFEFVASQAQMRDVLILDAYAKLISLEDTEKMLDYVRNHYYDVCFNDNIPEGIIPTIISGNFIQDFISLLEEGLPISSSLKKAVNWEYQGVDVGVYLSPSKIALKRVNFLPVDRGSVEFIKTCAVDEKFCLENAENYVHKNPEMIWNYPSYLAIELAPKTDGFYTLDFTRFSEMPAGLFKKIISEADQFAPEAVLSLGVWGEPFAHSKFQELFSELNDSPRHVLVESRSLVLDDSLARLVLSRPNTELIFDLSFASEEAFKKYKSSPYTLDKIKHFIRSLPNQEHIWVRLTRTHESEEHIMSFLKEWQEMLPRVLITKADSFGDTGIKVVELAPLRRHSCYALRREMTILSNGSVMLCRQDKNLEKILGSFETSNIQELWSKNRLPFFEQEQGIFNTCSVCMSCDDWWIWN